MVQRVALSNQIAGIRKVKTVALYCTAVALKPGVSCSMMALGKLRVSNRAQYEKSKCGQRDNRHACHPNFANQTRKVDSAWHPLTLHCALPLSAPGGVPIICMDRSCGRCRRRLS